MSFATNQQRFPSESAEVQRPHPSAMAKLRLYPKNYVELGVQNRRLGFNEGTGTKDFSRMGSSKTMTTPMRFTNLDEGLMKRSELAMHKMPRVQENTWTAKDVVQDIREDAPDQTREAPVYIRQTPNPNIALKTENAERNNQANRDARPDMSGMPNPTF